MESSISKVAGGSNAPEEVTKLANRIAEAHGCQVKLTNEASGYHIYIPCPSCLDTHGRSELQDPKYAINASMFLGIGDKWRIMGGDNPFMQQLNAEAAEDDRDHRCGVCMRTCQAGDKDKVHRWRLSEILQMATITARHPDIQSKAKVVGGAGSAEKESYWLPDPISGAPCPPPPGDVTPINELDPTHPGRTYLESRGYDVDKLWEQFRCSYCYREFPSGEKHAIWYKGKFGRNKWPGNWADSPQNRVILYALRDGVPVTWQARVLDFVSEDGLMRYYLNPYTNQWDLVETRANRSSGWMRIAPFDQENENGTFVWDPSKYKTASHSTRFPMGWDSAVQRVVEDPFTWCVLCEGPLDAARVGPGGLAMLGKSLSHDNAAKLVRQFQVIFTAFDNDSAGRAASEKVQTQLFRSAERGSTLLDVVRIPIAEGKDIGEMRQEDFDDLLARVLRKTKRKLGL